MRHSLVWRQRGAALAIALVPLVLCARAAIAGTTPTSTNGYSSVEVLATPKARCTLSGDGMVKPIKVWADDLGVVRFGAVHARPNEGIRALSLDCSDDNGNHTIHSVDLTSDQTFTPLPPQPVPSWVHVRPALVGDPMQYSQRDLIHRGYGRRPDRLSAPDRYAKWLQQSSHEMREVSTVHLVGNPPQPQLPTSSLENGSCVNLTSGSCQAGQWSGGALTKSGQYTAAFTEFSVPGLAATTSGCTSASLWAGLGGNGTLDLIQAGVEEFSQGSAVSLSTWYEYLSGSDNTLISLFNVSEDDDIIVDVWECNSSGDEVANGGFGCFAVWDDTNDQFVDCYLPQGDTAVSSNAFDCTVTPCTTDGYCASIAATGPYYGKTAEAIVENNSYGYCGMLGLSGTFAHFNSVNLTLNADLNGNGGHNYSTDSSIAITVTNGSGTAMDSVTTDDSAPDGTSFVWSRGS
jgi:hypothetical protein